MNTLIRQLTVAAGALALPALPAAAQDDTEPQPIQLFNGAMLQPGVPPGYVVIEGDIQVPVDWMFGPEATFGDTQYWQGGRIPFEFDANVTLNNAQLMLDAMTELEGIAGVDFAPRTFLDTDFVHIQNAGGNSSFTGRQGGQQNINIFNWNSRRIMQHELLHCAGFWHEQSRPDRDQYVTINYGNICTAQCNLCFNIMNQPVSCAYNFDIRQNAGTWAGYDFDSLMHYGQFDFSANGMATITVKAPWNTIWQTRIGQRTHISELDKFSLRGIYPFVGDRWLDDSYFGTQHGSFFQPWNMSAHTAAALTPTGAALIINPGSYEAVGTYTNPITIYGPAGEVVLR
jgi:hypothetical protein